jgi:hypothetical protein
MLRLFKSPLMVLSFIAAFGMMLSCSSGNQADFANDASIAADLGGAGGADAADKPPTAIIAAVDIIPQNLAPAPVTPATPSTPAVNLYFVTKDFAVEVVSSEMVCKIEAVGPELKCRSLDLKVSERKLHLDKSRNNLYLPNNVVSWESPCPEAANYMIRSILLCASADQLTNDVTTP